MTESISAVLLLAQLTLFRALERQQIGSVINLALTVGIVIGAILVALLGYDDASSFSNSKVFRSALYVSSYLTSYAWLSRFIARIPIRAAMAIPIGVALSILFELLLSKTLE